MSRSVTRLQSDIDRMVETLLAVRQALPELERRNRYAAGADGYPASSMGSSGHATFGRPTERAALSRPPVDPVRIWTRDALGALERAGRCIATVESCRRLVLDSGGLSIEAVDSPRVCGNPSCRALTAEPLRDSRCPACYQWRRRNGSERQGRRMSA
jgi:hypothetical protein